MDKYQSWLSEWFQENASIEQSMIETHLNDNYFELGWLDSFRFILFIEDIETEFGFRFSNEELQDETFLSLVGLASMIEEKVK